MRSRSSRLAAAVVVCFAASFCATAPADEVITDFNSPWILDELYPNWDLATEVSGTDSYSLTASGYGSGYKGLISEGILGAGNNTLQLELTLSGDTGGSGQLGPIVRLVDTDGTDYSYRWYGQTYGSKVLTSPVESPHTTMDPGLIPGLDLDNLESMFLELDPYLFTGSYTVEWQDLRLTTVTPPDPQVICDFNSTGISPYAGNWVVTNGADSMNITGSGFGGGWAPAFGSLDASGSTHVELDVSVNSADGPLNIVTLLEDADGTQHVWRWFGVDAGDHALSFRSETVTNANAAEPPNAIDQANSWSVAGSVAGLDLDNIKYFHVQIDPQNAGDSYDVSFNNYRVKNIPGGFDTDEDSDVSDLMVWQRGLTPGGGDATDLAEWQANFGSVGEAFMAGSAVQGVPEPTGAGLLLLGGLTLASARRGRRSR